MDSSDHKTNWLNVLTMFYGGAVGDALGFPFESRYGHPISDYHGKLEYKPGLIKRAGMKYGVVGAVSDDTEMTLALLRSIVDNNGKYSRNKAILAYEDVVNTRTPGVGKNIKKLFSGAKTVKEFNKRHRSHFNPRTKDGMNPERAQSNGSLMRCAPFALVPGKNYRNVVIDTDLTNPNNVNREAGVIYVKLLRELLFDKRDEVDSLNTAKTPEIKEAIFQARNKEVRDVATVGKGWIAHTFYCAVYCLLNFDNYEEAINWVIRLGGDTDTNAAVSGSLMGAKLGYNLLVDPTFETQLNIVASADTKLGDLKRPQRYLPREFGTDLVMRLGEQVSSIEMKSDNYKYALGYYNEGYSPCWYLRGEEDGFVFDVVVDDSIVRMLGEMDENDNYRINAIEVGYDGDVESILSKIQQDPGIMETGIESSMHLDNIYVAYRFLTRLMQALAELAISELNPYVSFSNPLDPVLRELYGKRFLLLNI